MQIARDRYLDDSSRFLYTLTLASRTIEAHSLLTALTPEEQAALGDVLVRALDEMQGILTNRLSLQARSRAG